MAQNSPNSQTYASQPNNKKKQRKYVIYFSILNGLLLLGIVMSYLVPCKMWFVEWLKRFFKIEDCCSFAEALRNFCAVLLVCTFWEMFMGWLHHIKISGIFFLPFVRYYEKEKSPRQEATIARKLSQTLPAAFISMIAFIMASALTIGVGYRGSALLPNTDHYASFAIELVFLYVFLTLVCALSLFSGAMAFMSVWLPVFGERAETRALSKRLKDQSMKQLRRLWDLLVLIAILLGAQFLWVVHMTTHLEKYALLFSLDTPMGRLSLLLVSCLLGILYRWLKIMHIPRDARTTNTRK